MSSPPTTHRSWHGVPAGVALKHDVAMSTKPMSFPPISRVTSWVWALRRSNCGGFGPGVTFCGFVMSSVVAPLQVASWNEATCSAAATRVA